VKNISKRIKIFAENAGATENYVADGNTSN
jgi:hypothetical protein